MDVLKNKDALNLEQTMLAELAKATNELRCSARDTEKAQNRLSFVLVLLNELIEREQDQKKGD